MDDYGLRPFDIVFKRLLDGYNYVLKRELCIYMISAYSRQAIQSSDLCNLSDRNKLFYKQYQRLFGFFRITLRSDSIISWLLLASFFYKCKRFRECTDVINYSLSNCTLDKILLQRDNSLAEQTVFQEMKQKYGLMIAHKHVLYEYICFREPFSLLPSELTPITNELAVLIPPVFYCHLLKFLCFYQLGDNRGKIDAINDMDQTIRRRKLVILNEPMLEKVKKIFIIVKNLLDSS